MHTGRGRDETETPIALQRVDQVIFRDDSYRWIDMSTFAFSSPDRAADPWFLLARLLSDSRYYINRYDVADNCPTDLSREQQARDNDEKWIKALATESDDPMVADALRRARAQADQPYSPRDTPPTHGPYLMSAIDLE